MITGQALRRTTVPDHDNGGVLSTRDVRSGQEQPRSATTLARRVGADSAVAKIRVNGNRTLNMNIN